MPPTFVEMMKEISSQTYRNDIKKIISTLEPDLVVGPILNDVLDNHGPETRCFLYWAARESKAKNYLEIGTRRGWSTATVASVLPECDIYCFDIWEENYSSSPNPGPIFVQQEVEKVGYKKKLNFINGDSHQTIPQFFKQNPDLKFDLMLIDGDHTVDGAYDDLKNTMPYINKGGYILFDDVLICERLDEVWLHMKKEFPNFDYFMYKGNNPGVGIAYKKE